MQEYAASLQAASQRYGVPAPVIAAIWGMESNYGSNFGSFSAVDALATLAFDGRRAEWAQKELIAALRIIDNGDIDAAHMISSWAGAMGNTQFLPSVFLQYAVDADGDGRRGSMADVAASTGYLASSGWNPGEPWGVEVRLPANFDYARTELSTRQNSNAWAAEGVQRSGLACDGRSQHHCTGRCPWSGLHGEQLPRHPALQQLHQLCTGREPARIAAGRQWRCQRRMAARSQRTHT
jgi:lytic murein transglycosylase